MTARGAGAAGASTLPRLAAAWLACAGCHVPDDPAVRGAHPRQIATIPDTPIHLALDATHVYWTSTYNDDTGRVSRVRKRGGPVEVLASGQASPFALAVDKDHVYWSNLGGSSGRGVIQKIPKAGGAPFTLADDEAPTSIAVADDGLYFFRILPQRVKRVPLDGGAATLVSSDAAMPASIVASASEVYWADFGTPGPKTHDGAIVRAGSPRSSEGATEVLARDLVHPQTLILCGDDLVFITPVPPLDFEHRRFELRRLSRRPSASPPAVQTIIRRDADWQPLLACDSRYVYFDEKRAERGASGNVDRHTVLRVPRLGGEAEVVVTGLRDLTHLVADDSGLYLGLHGRILKIAPDAPPSPAKAPRARYSVPARPTPLRESPAARTPLP